MEDVEGLAWSRQVLGAEGPHVRSVLPWVLVATHNRFVATYIDLNLGNATPYGLMWLGVPKALVSEFAGLAGVQVYHPPRASYKLPVINGVPLIPWRYAKDRKTNVEEVLFGKPVSEPRKSAFKPLDLEAELPLGEEGLGSIILDELTRSSARSWMIMAKISGNWQPPTGSSLYWLMPVTQRRYITATWVTLSLAKTIC